MLQGLDEHSKNLLRLAAKLHDIGKVGLAEGILNKPAKLSDHEFDLVKEHPVIGERILRPIIRNRMVLSAIRSHHERFGGEQANLVVARLHGKADGTVD